MTDNTVILDCILLLLLAGYTLHCRIWLNRHQVQARAAMNPTVLPFIHKRIAVYLSWVAAVCVGMTAFAVWRLVTVLNALHCQGVSVAMTAMIFGVSVFVTVMLKFYRFIVIRIKEHFYP